MPVRTAFPRRGLPNDPVFRHLVHAAAHENKPIVRDSLQNIEADYARFLGDILQYRLKVSSVLPTEILDDNGMFKDNDNFILLSAPSSYQFLVALFAILAIGGAAVLLPPGIAPEEITTIALKCNARAFAFVPDHPTAGKATQVRAKDTSGAEVLPVPITLADNGGSANISIAIEDNIRFPADRPALVQFTSATTGPPKGVVHARKFFYYQVEVYFGCPMSEAKGLQTLLGADAVYLSYRSFHWGGGIRNATAAILAGVCTEIYNHDATPGDIWERLKRGDVTFFICRAAMWTQMKVYYEECLTSLPKPMLEEYIIGARRLRLAKSDSSLLTPSVKRFWNNLGVSIGINYAATETSITIGKQCVSFEEIDERIIGVPLTGVSVKLSEGDHGEICIKTPLVFSHYIGEPEATRAAFDEEGFYRTGDLGHFDGKQYILDGRETQDFISFNGCKVPIIDIEESLMALPYITEAYILGIPDEEVISRTAVLLRVKEGKCLNLQTLRMEMAERLAEHKLPTLLRMLDSSEDVPKTHSGKFDMRKARSVFFPQSIEGDISDLPPEVEVWKLK